MTHFIIRLTNIPISFEDIYKYTVVTIMSQLLADYLLVLTSIKTSRLGRNR